MVQVQRRGPTGE